ncbi:hypothetical protein [Oceanithermus sp.]
MRRRLLVLSLAALLLSGCRYTFWPLIPPEAAYPERASLSGELVEQKDRVVAVINVRRWPEPDYLELRWYHGEELLKEASIWVEKPQKLKVELPYQGEGFYRLLLYSGGRPLLQLDLGEPSLPPPPASPGQEPGAG